VTVPPTDKPEQPVDDLGFKLPEPAKPGAGRMAVLIVLVLLALAGAFLFGYLPRREQSAALARDAKQTETEAISVEVVQPKRIESTKPISLPASLQPLAETVLYPRANGYVQSFAVDIGEQVKEGQPLAQIETPELDSQLDQARAGLQKAEAAHGQAKAQHEYAKTSLARFERLQPSGVTSQQELDQRSAEARVSEANVVAAQASIEVARADVRRLSQLKAFARVSAPFDGTIIQRTVERGALVSAGNSTPLFRLAKTDPLRAFVQVPQNLAVGAKVGAAAKISVREYPGRAFEGTISRVAGALDASTRTMTTEVWLPNPKHELLPGMYAQASLTLSGTHVVYELPATALYSDASGLRVAVVDAQNKLHFKAIVLERDAGPTIEIASGLDGDERVVKLANAALDEGETVRVR
jgi:membrane fusion protein, multidrug efflux system